MAALPIIPSAYASRTNFKPATKAAKFGVGPGKKVPGVISGVGSLGAIKALTSVFLSRGECGGDRSDFSTIERPSAHARREPVRGRVGPGRPDALDEESRRGGRVGRDRLGRNVRRR